MIRLHRGRELKQSPILLLKVTGIVLALNLIFLKEMMDFTGLSSLYSLNFRKIVELDINLKFNALENGTVDVINAFSTDSRIKQMNLRTLRDDKKYFPAYQAGIVVRNETLKNHPELEPLLLKLNNTIDDSTMTMLNYEVEINKKSTEEVAYNFLRSKGLVK